MKKIALITNQRSGGYTVQSYLNDHPYVHIQGEILDKVASDKKKEMLENTYSIFATTLGKIRVFGVQIFYNQLEDWMFQYFKENDIKIVHIVRNTDTRFLLWFRGHYEVVSEQPYKVRANIEEMLNYRDFVERKRKQCKDYRDYLLDYADIVPDEKGYWSNYRSRRPFLQWLGVVDKKLKTDTFERYPYDLDSVVVNYKELQNVVV